MKFSNNNKILPSKAETIKFTQNLCVWLFPAIEGEKGINTPNKKIIKTLNKLLKPIENRLKTDKESIINSFLSSLPDIKKKLQADAGFINECDPASTCKEEVMLTYPGFYAILVFRLANKLYELNVPLIPRIMTEHAHSVTGIDIHPGATIGDNFCIDHGTGIVIGETSVIGNKVKIYQGVTIGALSVKKNKVAKKRHPTIEDNVIIYAGSTILGGETTIGHDSVIGGNVWLTNSIPPYSIAQNKSNISINQKKKKENIKKDN